LGLGSTVDVADCESYLFIASRATKLNRPLSCKATDWEKQMQTHSLSPCLEPKTRQLEVEYGRS